MTTTSEHLIELYAAPGRIEADRLVLLLQEDGVEVITRPTTSSMFPVEGPMLLLVPEHDVARARSTIENARREGAVGYEGEFQIR
ncbi:MAG TPA: hypothetical protein VGF99_05925 [Myxococcota bacterium]